MAQATKTKGGGSKRASRSRPKSTSSNGNKATASKTRPANSRARSANSTARSKAARRRSVPETIKDAAVDKAKTGGHAVATTAAKAKTPLIAGGTAIVGVAAGAVLQDRLSGSRKGPLKRVRSMSLPKSARKLDLDTVRSAAERVSAYGRQASDIAAAVEKTRKKNG